MAFIEDNGKQQVVSSDASQISDAFWNGQTLTMFVHDLDECEAQIEESARPI